MSDNQTPMITLAGGGLVGSLLALILAKKGYRVEVYESRPDLRRVDISAGRSINLALANRGIKPLEQLGLMSKINDMIIPMRGRMVHVEGETATLQPYGQHEYDVIYSISRGELNSFLLTEAENTGLVTIHFDSKISQVDFDTNQLSIVQGEHSQTVSFDKLIGTDGANSVVRDAILALNDNSQLSVDVLDHSYKELHISPDSQGQHKIDKQALHIWPRGQFMLIALPNQDGSFTVTLFMHTQGETSFATVKDEATINAFFDAHFASIKPELENLVGTYIENPTGSMATIKCGPWNYADKGLIIGDAAHAIVPFHGQGMNCGFEDCQSIAEHFPAANEAESADWHALFANIAKLRKPNADAIADMALENYIEMRDSVIQDSFLQKKAFAFKLQQWFPARFTPRYAMVMFQHRPYQEAYALGKIHDRLLQELCESYSSVDELTQQDADTLLTRYGL
ncbi:NAD(P)/FAD-dependent oxidoreductase [Aliiglaciecola litoralis]|uniref:Kynurenine 3-monooxygenase n=1 Tax=Aliiglaciecola litoralis TaxID=582857 RepID=A0ABP3WTL7_9ALTE